MSADDISSAGQAVLAQAKGRACEELETVARIMSEHRIDSVKMPSGLEVLKTTHLSLEASASPEAVEEAVQRRLEAMGLLAASEDSGRVPVEQDEVLFAASRAPRIDLEDFAAHPEVEETPDE